MTYITFLGDVFLPSPVRVEKGIEGPFILNLEAPITRGRNPTSGKILLRTEVSHLAATFGRKPAAVCLANNHMLDFGDEGLAETMADLERQEVAYFGAGAAQSHYGNPRIVGVEGKRIALLGYLCPSTNPAQGTDRSIQYIEMSAIVADIARCREQMVDRIVVNLHWGDEGCSLPRPQDGVVARKIIDAGADLIIGHHAHCIQGHEVYCGKYIFYGLGNCIFPNFDVVVSDPAAGVRVVERCIWRSWNNRSMAVRYFPDTNRCEMFELNWVENSRLQFGSRMSGRQIDTSSDGYRTRYGCSRFWGSLRHASGRFWARPKIPRLRHARILWSWLSLSTRMGSGVEGRKES